MFSSVGVSGFSSHEVEESIERHVTHVVGVDNRHDALEVSFALQDRIKVKNLSWREELGGTDLSVISDVVSEGDEAGFEFLGFQTTRAALVKVEEGFTELFHLFVGDAL